MNHVFTDDAPVYHTSTIGDFDGAPRCHFLENGLAAKRTAGMKHKIRVATKPVGGRVHGTAVNPCRHGDGRCSVG